MTFSRRCCALVICGWVAFSSVVCVAQLAQDQPQVSNPVLRDALLKRMEWDQKSRKAVMESAANSIDHQPNSQLLQDMHDLDAANRQWLEDFLAKYSWPTQTEVGKDGAHAAWMIVQHADAAPLFQRKCLIMIRELFDARPREVDPVDLAYLTDRVRVANGLKQQYGTQVQMRNGIFRAIEIEKPDEVERLRANLGLQSMENYLYSLEQHYARTRGSRQIR